jgi:hypothetical protein
VEGNIFFSGAGAKKPPSAVDNCAKGGIMMVRAVGKPATPEMVFTQKE